MTLVFLRGLIEISSRMFSSNLDIGASAFRAFFLVDYSCVVGEVLDLGL